jgi:hypothetical protein
MNSGPPTVVLNLYDWLPAYGESRITIRSHGLEWVVGIVYDDPSSSGLLMRELVFHRVCCFYEQSFPGPRLLCVDPNQGEHLGSLVEYPESEAALAWSQHWGGSRVVRHYSLVLLSENLAIEVFATEFALSEPTRVERG